MADGTDVADETHLLDLTGKPHVTEFAGRKTIREINQYHYKELVATGKSFAIDEQPNLAEASFLLFDRQSSN